MPRLPRCPRIALVLAATASSVLLACGEGDGGGDGTTAGIAATAGRNEVSPVRRIDREGRGGRDRSRHRDCKRRRDRDCDRRAERDPHDRHGRDRGDGTPLGPRSIDGRGNNEAEEDWGAAETRLLRLLPPDYHDGISSPAGARRPTPREISNRVVAQRELSENALGTSDYLWQWGQFLDHDIDLTDGASPPEPHPIEVPIGDPHFDPARTGTATIEFNRSIHDTSTGSGPGDPREQLNEITSYIDASNVYGSDDERAAALRTLDGTGRLATSAGGLLPFNVDGLPNAGGSGPELFLAGDVRANEQAALAAMHTLFVREHNRLAARYARQNPDWDGEQLYQKARQIVGALMQVITYREFLPALLGPEPLPAYRGYDDDLNAGIANAFSTAAYRFGHSALSPVLRRLDRRGREIDAGHLPLRAAFFAPDVLIDEGGIEPLLRGLAAQRHQRIDVQVVDDVRNFLFGPPGAGGFDLASLNIQRGRDHGLPGYNATRVALGLDRARRFSDVTRDRETRRRLESIYDGPDDIDLWVGCLAETPLPGSHLGELATRIIVDQFVALRDGDRHWYARVLARDEREAVEDTRLSDIIRRNTSIGNELPRDVFRVR